MLLFFTILVFQNFLLFITSARVNFVLSLATHSCGIRLPF